MSAKKDAGLIPLDLKSLSVTVTPSSRKREILSYDGKATISLKNKPENNKANEELERFLSLYFDKEVKVVRGKTTKNKIVSIR